MNELEIYIHIPFCVRKCHYCDFLSFASDEDTRHKYTGALIREIKNNADVYSGRKVISVFIGGGTPTILELQDLKKIMTALKESFDIEKDAEITIEANPGTVDFDKLKGLREIGINRISFGLQSADDKDLLLLGRIHTYSQFLDNYKNAVKAGFTNINIDLISSLPGQRFEDFEKTLSEIISLKPQHISAYSLIVEEGTAVYNIYEQAGNGCSDGVLALFRDSTGNIIELPDEEEDRRIYHNTRAFLEENGYHQYEISNYALNAFECQHNKGYWERRDYVGFGLGAASLVNGSRWKNTDSLQTYFAIMNNDCVGRQLTEEFEWLSHDDEMSEAMFLGLRMNEGVNIKQFIERYGDNPLSIYGEWIGKMAEDGLLTVDECIKLTLKGMDLANYVMSGFV